MALVCREMDTGVSFESPGLENIPHVPENQVKVGQDQDARKAVSATFFQS